MRKSRIQLLVVNLLAVAQFAAHSASAECSYNARGANYCGDYGVSQEKSKAREERIKKANRDRAAKLQEERQAAAIKKMKEEVRAEKDRLAKGKGAPEVTTQKCYLVNGQLNCK